MSLSSEISGKTTRDARFSFPALLEQALRRPLRVQELGWPAPAREPMGSAALPAERRGWAGSGAAGSPVQAESRERLAGRGRVPVAPKLAEPAPTEAVRMDRRVQEVAAVSGSMEAPSEVASEREESAQVEREKPALALRASERRKSPAGQGAPRPGESWLRMVPERQARTRRRDPVSFPRAGPRGP